MAKLSLQDQLLKSGLVSSAKAKSIKSEKLKQVQMQRKNKVAVVDKAKELAQKAQEEKAQKDKELNQLRKQQEEQKEVAAQIKQLIEQNKQALPEDGIAYNFSDNNKVKRLYVSESIRDKIADGRLAIVRYENGYEVVSADVAEKIQQRDAESIIVLLDKITTEEDKSDPYAAYQVPDDLMW